MNTTICRKCGRFDCVCGLNLIDQFAADAEAARGLSSSSPPAETRKSLRDYEESGADPTVTIEDEGHDCPLCDEGHLELKPDPSCTCGPSPAPCAGCENSRLRCNKCSSWFDWEE